MHRKQASGPFPHAQPSEQSAPNQRFSDPEAVDRREHIQKNLGYSSFREGISNDQRPQFLAPAILQSANPDDSNREQDELASLLRKDKDEMQLALRKLKRKSLIDLFPASFIFCIVLCNFI